MLVIVAVAMVVLIGVMGLAIDLGYGFVQRRTMQNAADAGALAGAELITKWSSTNNISVSSSVQAIVALNSTGPIIPTMASCNYVSDAGINVGDCSLPVPPTATGVQVSTTETHSTFFIRAVPGAPTTMTTSAASTAQVYRVTNAPGDGPFIVCGTVDGQFADSPSRQGPQVAQTSRPPLLAGTLNALGSVVRLASFHPDAPQAPALLPASTFNGSNVPILERDDSINPNAVGQTYVIHDGNPHSVNDCGAGDSFKGLADQNANSGSTVPGTWYGDNGTRAGPTRFQVSGIDGCQDNASDFDSCVLLLPVADSGNKQGSTITMHVVAVAAFLVYSGSSGLHARPPGCTTANCHVGTLLGQYVIGPDSGWPPQPQTGWLPGSNGVLMVRITH